LTATGVQANGEGLVRAGAQALSLLADSLNALLLRALADGPVGLGDLTRVVGVPPPTTMRVHLRTLTENGILERRQQKQFPGPVDYQLAPAGGDLLEVASALERWLSEAPSGPLSPGSSAAKSTTKALAEGWSSTIVRALASRPLALTDLSRLITGLSYPSLERRLNAMRMAGLIERCSSSGRRATPYEVTPWLRLAVVPLTAAARWERRHMPETTPAIQKIDIEAAFLLALPLVSLPPECAGVCRLVVDTSSGAQHRQAGVLAKVQEGVIASCTTRLDGSADALVSGSASGWVKAVVQGGATRLELGGDRELALALVEKLHATLRP
jgi:DNA-binding HxlR family transcriptional regulator